jgi:3-deoxy-manno-octulosonate cytidylyltransferase (CMP-KDO synthetase)
MQSLDGGIVAMVQGDEPLLVPEAVNKVVQPLIDDTSLEVVNILSPLESSEDYNNPNIVKAVCNRKKEVIFLTRAPVPFFREHEMVPVFRQTGIMAFRSQFLHRFSALPETALERAESVDMLRVIEHGIRIKAVVVDYITLGVDRPCDVAAVENVLENDPSQKILFEQIMNMERL